MALTSTQRKRLRGLAHGLKPVVRLGKDGVTETVVGELDRALDHHELVKVRLVGDRDERTRDSEALADRTGAEVAGTIGSVAILFRRQHDPDRRTVDV